MHYGTWQTVSFSTHSIAEELGFSRNDVLENFDEIEMTLLEAFFSFVRERRDKFWVHWNMRNITYGFEHIEHRYRKLNQKDPPIVPVERRINLNDMLSERFGTGYTEHPKLQHLMEANGGRRRHFLSGPEEVDAFNRCEFIRMHQSTLCKVEFFRTVIARTIDGRLRINSNSLLYRADRLFDSRLARAIGACSSAIGVITPLIGLLIWLFR